MIGVGFFVKYAIDKDWINETFRTVIGFLTGAALLAVAERLQKKYRTFSSLLAGGAFAVFYLTVAIAFHSYHIFSQTVAFVILVGVTVFMSFVFTYLIAAIFILFSYSSGSEIVSRHLFAFSTLFYLPASDIFHTSGRKDEETEYRTGVRYYSE